VIKQEWRDAFYAVFPCRPATLEAVLEAVAPLIKETVLEELAEAERHAAHRDHIAAVCAHHFYWEPLE